MSSLLQPQQWYDRVAQIAEAENNFYEDDVHVHLLPEAEFAPQDAEARVQNTEGALDGGARPANGVGEKSVNTVGGGARGGGGARTYLL